MDAPASPETQPAPPRDAIIRLADEGIPVRAIARGLKVPADEVYPLLRGALREGYLVEMPKDDWPIGSSRSARTVFNDTPLENEDALKVACALLFKATRLEAAILAVLIKRNEVTKRQLHAVIEQTRDTGRDETDPKMIDVVICHLRKKLGKHTITIQTVWGIGYLMPLKDRERAIAMLREVRTGS
jgi:Transcriptional regulatory protein, C terminal